MRTSELSPIATIVEEVLRQPVQHLFHHAPPIGYVLKESGEQKWFFVITHDAFISKYKVQVEYQVNSTRHFIFPLMGDQHIAKTREKLWTYLDDYFKEPDQGIVEVHESWGTNDYLLVIQQVFYDVEASMPGEPGT